MNKKNLKIAYGVVIIVLLGVVVYLVYGNKLGTEFQNTGDVQQQTTTSTSNTTQPLGGTAVLPRDKTADWKVYTSTKYNFLIQYPQNWNYRERSDGAVGFDPTDTAQLDADVTTYEISVSPVSNLKHIAIENWFLDYYNGSPITDQKIITINGLSAVQTKQAPSIGYPITETHIFLGDMVYIVRLSNAPEAANAYDHILSTFEFAQ